MIQAPFPLLINFTSGYFVADMGFVYIDLISKPLRLTGVCTFWFMNES